MRRRSGVLSVATVAVLVMACCPFPGAWAGAIDDITAVLDRTKPDPGLVARARAAADAQPSPDLKGLKLGQFLFDRGKAASAIGRSQQQIEDFAAAAEIARQAQNRHFRISALKALCIAQTEAGRVAAAAAACQDVISQSFFSEAVWLSFYGYRQMTHLSILAGDVESAKKWLELAARRINENRSGRRAAYGRSVAPAEMSLVEARAIAEESAGQWARAEQSLREARNYATQAVEKISDIKLVDHSASADDFVEQVHLLTGAVARVIAKQGRMAEAETEARRALFGMLELRGRYSSEAAASLLQLAEILSEDGRSDEAEILAGAAVDSYENAGHGADSAQLAQARLELAQVRVNLGRFDSALPLYDRVDRDLSEHNPSFRVAILGSDLGFGLALLRTGRREAALSVFREAVEKHTRTLGASSYAAAEARGFLAMARGRLGEKSAAAAEFRGAVPTLLAGSHAAALSSSQVLRLRTIVEAYMGVLADAAPAGTDVASETFHLADAIRGRSVQRALSAASARASTRDAAMADLVRRGQDSERQLAAQQQVLNGILARPVGDQDQKTREILQAQIEATRAAHTAIRQEIERRFPQYSNLANPSPATVDQVRRVLRRDEALVATYAGQEQTFVWAVPASGPVGFAAVPLGHPKIKEATRALRRALDPKATSLEDIPEFDVKMAHALYLALLKPVAAGWESASNLHIVAQGPLGQLPFDVLVTEPYDLRPRQPGQPLFSNYTDVPWLSRKVAISWLPSVASLASLRSAPAPSPSRSTFIGFGDPWFNARQAEQAQRQVAVAEPAAEISGRGFPLVRRGSLDTDRLANVMLAQLPRLPDTADEVKAIGAVLGADPQRDIFLGGRASKHRVKTADLSNRRILLFATHGLTAGEIEGLNQPALALTPGSLTGESEDGLLTLADIMSLRLNADWVVLSACNTAAADGAGAEAVSGLGRAFFYAGARSLLVTHWPVETTSARDLTVDLFRKQAAGGISRAQALRAAKMSLAGSGYTDARSGRRLFSYAHPLFWAPFALVGETGS